MHDMCGDRQAPVIQDESILETAVDDGLESSVRSHDESS
jgi:hypothetical protein